MILSSLATCALLAAVSFPYQGSICDDAGNPTLGASAEIEFRLYETVDLSESLWGRKCTVGLQTNGLFAVEVSDAMGEVLKDTRTNTLDAVMAIVGTRPFYVGVKLKGRPQEVRPRSRVMPLPTVTVADSADSAVGEFVVSNTVLAKAPSLVNVESNLVVNGASRAFQLTSAGALTASGLTVTNALVGFGGLTVSGEMDTGGLEAKELSPKLDLSVPSAEVGSVEAAEVSVGSLVGEGAFAVTNATPKGMIIMWYGDKNKIPAGWALCDGKKTADGYTPPDLTDRFIVGAASAAYTAPDGQKYPLGQKGGEPSVTLAVKHLPAHTHSITDRQHDYASTYMEAEYKTEGYTYKLNEDWKPAIGTSHANKKTETAGGGKAHDNLPPYCAVYFLIRYR